MVRPVYNDGDVDDDYAENEANKDLEDAVENVDPNDITAREVGDEMSGYDKTKK